MAMGAAAVGLSAAQAGTIDTFDWVTTSAVGGTTAVSGTLTLTLPGITTGTGAGTFTSTNASAALAEAEITGFSFTYSDGLSVGLADLTAPVSPATGSEVVSSPYTWATSNDLSPVSGTPTGYYLITGFQLSGKKNFPPSGSGLATFSIANAAGLVGNVGPSSAGITPQASQGVAANDAGYWVLNSSVTTPVPVPAALPLLLSGLAGFAALGRRRRAPA
jgi:hypothetical protein